MKYKCVKNFYIELYDDDGFSTGEYTVVSAGTMWELNKIINNIGGEVHLDNGLKWIEITRDTLNECFKEVKE